MPTYRYEGFNAAGKPKQGRVDAASEGDASAKCRDAGLFLQKLEPDGAEPMKTVLHHQRQEQQEQEFLSSEDEAPIVDRPRIHSPADGQNYAPAWQPSWRKPATSQVAGATSQVASRPGVVNNPRDTQTEMGTLLTEPYQTRLALRVHDVAVFYHGCLAVMQQKHTGPFPDLLKAALEKKVSLALGEALDGAFAEFKAGSPELTKPDAEVGFQGSKKKLKKIKPKSSSRRS